MNKKPSDEQNVISISGAKSRNVWQNGQLLFHPEKEIFSYINTELAWAAGYFDGEGSVGYYLGKGNGNNGCVRVVIGNTQVEELKRFQSAVGGLGRITGPRNFDHRKSMWKWQAQNFESAQAVTALLWKYLSSNKKNDFVKAWTSDKVVRHERANRPHCKEGIHGLETYTLVKGTPRCRVCMSAHLNKSSLLGLLFLGYL